MAEAPLTDEELELIPDQCVVAYEYLQEQDDMVGCFAKLHGGYYADRPNSYTYLLNRPGLYFALSISWDLLS